MSHMFPYDLLGGRVEEEKEAAAPPRRGRRRDRDRYAASDSPTSVPVAYRDGRGANATLPVDDAPMDLDRRAPRLTTERMSTVPLPVPEPAEPVDPAVASRRQVPGMNGGNLSDRPPSHRSGSGSGGGGGEGGSASSASMGRRTPSPLPSPRQESAAVATAAATTEAEVEQARSNAQPGPALQSSGPGGQSVPKLKRTSSLGRNIAGAAGDSPPPNGGGGGGGGAAGGGGSVPPLGRTITGGSAPPLSRSNSGQKPPAGPSSVPPLSRSHSANHQRSVPGSLGGGGGNVSSHSTSPSLRPALSRTSSLTGAKQLGRSTSGASNASGASSGSRNRVSYADDLTVADMKPGSEGGGGGSGDRRTGEEATTTMTTMTTTTSVAAAARDAVEGEEGAHVRIGRSLVAAEGADESKPRASLRSRSRSPSPSPAELGLESVRESSSARDGDGDGGGGGSRFGSRAGSREGSLRNSRASGREGEDEAEDLRNSRASERLLAIGSGDNRHAVARFSGDRDGGVILGGRRNSSRQSLLESEEGGGDTEPPDSKGLLTREGGGVKPRVSMVARENGLANAVARRSNDALPTLEVTKDEVVAKTAGRDRDGGRSSARNSLASDRSSLAQDRWKLARDSVESEIAAKKSAAEAAMELSMKRKAEQRKLDKKTTRQTSNKHELALQAIGSPTKPGSNAESNPQTPKHPNLSGGDDGGDDGGDGGVGVGNITDPDGGGGGDDDDDDDGNGGGGGGDGGGEDDDEENDLEVNHNRLLYLISIYNTQRAKGDEEADENGLNKNVWVRKVPLMVLIYEGIVAGVFDYDYAPAPDIVDGKRVYMNISQEGRDDLDDLREAGMLYGLKLSSKKYQSTVALRITAIGEEHLRRKLTAEDREAVLRVAYAPDEATSEENLLKVSWDSNQGRFMLRSENGYEMESTITEIESVSYVSSPYIPSCVRKWGRENKQNTEQTSALVDAVSTIKDELDEYLTLNDVRLVIGEWIPMGANQIVALNDKLGSSERVQGGFFTSVVDQNPDASEFIGESEGLTEVDILDFDETAYVNFEAEVHFPEEDGVIQVENFGVHINDEGFINYGLRCEGIMHAVKDELSLDNLSRLLVDVQVDSSKIIDNLVSPHQRVMLDMTYLNDSEHREKYNVIFCSRINKKGRDEMPSADEFMDKEANENELKQVIGDTHASYQLSPDDEVLIVGRNGIVLCSGDTKRLEPQIMSYLSLMTRNMFMRSLFQRTFILADTLKHIRELIDTYESDPNSISTIRNLLSEASGDIILLSETQSYLVESLQEVELPVAPSDMGAQRLERILHIEATQKRLVRRVNDMKKNIEGARGEVSSLRSMADVVSEGKEFKVQEAVQNNTKNLEDVFRANERASASLEIMQIVLAGSLAFDIIDRLHGLYLGIAGDIDWANNIFSFVYETPGMLLLVNMAWWGVLGSFIQGLIKHLGEQAAGVMSIRYQINQRIDWVAFEKFIHRMHPEVEDGDRDKHTYIKKFTWDEPDSSLWKGLPPRIEVTVDAKYHYLLKAFLQISTKKSKVTQKEAKCIFFWRMRNEGILQGAVPGLEDEAEVEETDRALGRNVSSKKGVWSATRVLGGGDGVEDDTPVVTALGRVTSRYVREEKGRRNSTEELPNNVVKKKGVSS